MIRRLVHNFLNFQKSASYVPYQDLENKQMLFELLTVPHRFLDSTRRYAMSLTSSIVFGFRTTSFDDPRQKELFEVLDTVTELVQSAAAAMLEVFPVLRWLPDALSPTEKQAKEGHKKEVRLFGGLWLNVKEAVKAGKAKPSMCVDMANVQEKEGFSDELASYMAGTVLEAGADTTANTIYAFIQAMILFPEVQKKAQQCVDKIVGGDRLPNMDDYSLMPYISNCMNEATRWFPTAILGFPHAVMQDDEYMGYHIPKGAGIILNVYAIHMDPKRHPDPLRFDPDRFKDDVQGLNDFGTNSEPARRGTFAFGAGRRVCQGMHVAERSLFLAISRILWAFDILPAKDESGNDVIPDGSKLSQGFVCMPEPYQATIRPRSAEKAALIRKFWNEAQKDLDLDSEQWK